MTNEIFILNNNIFEASESVGKVEKSIPSANPMVFVRLTDFNQSSIFTADDQNSINRIMLSYQDTIPHDSLLEKVKDYEAELNQPSLDFYMGWKKGLIDSDPRTSEWASIYRVLYGNN